MLHILRRVGITALLLALSPAWALAQTTPPPVTNDVLLSSEFKPKPYVIGPGDKLQLVFLGLQNSADIADMNREYTVQADGTIVVKWAGPVPVNDLTELQARDAVRSRLVPRFFADATLQLDVKVTGERLQEVFVQGQVNAPGARQLPGSRMFVSRAIAEAGNFGANAGTQIDIKRGDKTFSVTRAEVEGGNDPPLLPGDTVFVSTAQFVFVSGEVGAAGQKKWEPGLTVSRAIVMSGGMTSKGKLGEIRRPVLQKNGTIKYEKIKGGKLKMDTILQPNDELYIARKWIGGL